MEPSKPRSNAFEKLAEMVQSNIIAAATPKDQPRKIIDIQSTPEYKEVLS